MTMATGCMMTPTTPDRGMIITITHMEAAMIMMIIIIPTSNGGTIGIVRTLSFLAKKQC